MEHSVPDLDADNEVRDINQKLVPECPPPNKADILQLKEDIEKQWGPKFLLNPSGNWYIDRQPDYIVDLNKGTVTDQRTNQLIHGYNIPQAIQIKAQTSTNI
jgi:hypothetical protein